MSKKIVTPKFLTPRVAEEVISSVLSAAMGRESLICRYLKRKMCHIVVLVPAMEDARATNYPFYPNYPLQPVVLYEHSVDEANWPHEFDGIARCKALQLWHDRNDDRTDVMPHLLFPGDTPYWGGVKRHGLVVTCSGVQPHFDKMISGMIADGLIAVAYELWKISEDMKKGVSFLT